MAKETVYQRIDKFHAHLDICSQCEKHPFALCATGAKLLKEAATGEVDESWDEGPHHPASQQY